MVPNYHRLACRTKAERRIAVNRARDLFPADTADLIESRDRELLAGDSENELSIRTVGTPNNGQRLVAVRRLRIAGEDGESHIFLSMIDDRTDLVPVRDVAA